MPDIQMQWFSLLRTASDNTIHTGSLPIQLNPTEFCDWKKDNESQRINRPKEKGNMSG
jgi:hypothetical protein